MAISISVKDFSWVIWLVLLIQIVRNEIISLKSKFEKGRCETQMLQAVLKLIGDLTTFQRKLIH